MDEGRANQGVEHVQAAARELLSAARAFLDVVEDVVEDPERLTSAAASVTDLVRGLTGARPQPWERSAWEPAEDSPRAAAWWDEPYGADEDDEGDEDDEDDEVPAGAAPSKRPASTTPAKRTTAPAAAATPAADQSAPKRPAARKAAAKKSATKKSPAKKSPAKKSPAKKAPARKPAAAATKQPSTTQAATKPTATTPAATERPADANGPADPASGRISRVRRIAVD